MASRIPDAGSDDPVLVLWDRDSRCWLVRRPASMARPYSLDLRERVVLAVAEGASCRRVAEAFKVSVATVVKWSQRYRATGSAAAKPMGGPRQPSLAAHEEWLLGRLAAKPDLTLRALVVELGERGLVTSYGAFWRAVHRAGISFKKNAVRHRARSARRGAKTGAVAQASEPT
jgi:transposase